MKEVFEKDLIPGRKYRYRFGDEAFYSFIRYNYERNISEFSYRNITVHNNDPDHIWYYFSRDSKNIFKFGR